MNSYCMKNGRNESVLNSFYHDAYIHTEDKKVFMVHKVMVATHSPFLHEYFQSRPGHDVNDVFFQSTHSSTVQAALDLMYNGEVSIETKYIKSFKWFLETLLCVMVEDKTEVMHQRPQKVTNRSMVPPNSTADMVPPFSTASIVPPTPSAEMVPPTPTAEMVPPTPTAEMVPPTPTSEMVPPTPTAKMVSLTSTTNMIPSSSPVNIVPPTLAGQTDGPSSSLDSVWTVTSVSSEDLPLISHSYFDIAGDKRHYKCEICKHVSKTFGDATSHFFVKHQNSQVERKQLEEAMNARKKCVAQISKLKIDIEKGCNKTMAMNQLDLITNELNKHLDVVSDFDKTKYLPPTISMKGRDMCHALSQTLKEIDKLVKQ